MTNPLLEELKASLETQRDVAQLIVDRVRNFPVIADEDGSVVMRAGGVWPITSVGDVAQLVNFGVGREELKRMQEAQPDNHVLARMEVIGIKEAAKRQLEKVERIWPEDKM